VIVLTRAVLGHGRHDLRRHILHVLADHFGSMPVWLVSGWRLFGELLYPLSKDRPSAAPSLSVQRLGRPEVQSTTSWASRFSS
jgi:hypothetical protein